MCVAGASGSERLKALKQTKSKKMNLLAKCKHQQRKSYWMITTVFVLKTNVINWCNFHDNSWHRSMWPWANIVRKRVATHVSCCLKLRSLIWLAKENIRREKSNTNLQLPIKWLFLAKRGLGQQCTGTEVVDTQWVSTFSPLIALTFLSHSYASPYLKVPTFVF